MWPPKNLASFIHTSSNSNWLYGLFVSIWYETQNIKVNTLITWTVENNSNNNLNTTYQIDDYYAPISDCTPSVGILRPW